MPNFLKERDQFTNKETVKSQQVANEKGIYAKNDSTFEMLSCI